MTYEIKKVGVIGSGTMGAGIAALLAGIDIPVILLDLPAPDTTPDSPKRNSIIQNNLKALQKAKPAQLYEATDFDLLQAGNLEDDFERLADCDWLVEVIVERLAPKQALMARLEEIAKPTAIISSNTSGLSINAIAEGRSADFKRRFLGTHFFNPPRYLKLLEIIPCAETDPALVEFMTHFGTFALGKGVVICKDTPNFIGNRFMSISGSMAINYAVDHGYTIEEVDAITGPLIGRPKSATFRLNDVVGVDIAAGVARNLYDAIPDDPMRDVLIHDGATKVFDYLLENKFLGSKTGQGFFKTVKGAGGKEFWQLDLQTLEYRAPEKPRFDSVSKHRKVEDTGERIRLLVNEDDRAAQYIWHLHAGLLTYAAQKLGEITDDILSIDNANKWGFGHELGPFEIWDALGVADAVARMEADGYIIPLWVKDMLAKGFQSFYKRDAKGGILGYYDPTKGDYVLLEPNKNIIIIDKLRADDKVVQSWDESSLLDMGDGVLLLEFHSKMNAIGADHVTASWRALEYLDQGAYEGLVIGNQGDNFSVGANIAMVGIAAGSGELGQLEAMIKQMQDVTQALRYASKPVVTAPFGMCLGGGAEYAMAGWRTVAHVETYMGLVELGVGLVPGSGGCKEMIRRVINPVMQSSPNADVLPHLQKVFEQVGTAKVAESAHQARAMGFLSPQDRIIMNRDHLLAEAKAEVLALLATGASHNGPGLVYAAGRDALAVFKLGAWQLQEGGYASEYDAFLGQRLAYILTGGDLSAPQWVPEQYILDLERQVFIELVQEQKTLDRIGHMLATGKPLRN